MIRVVTTFSRGQWDQYVHVLLPRSIELWPKEVEWQVWVDDYQDANPVMSSLSVDGSVWQVLFLRDDPEHEAFMARWRQRVERNPALKHNITVGRYPTGYTLDAGTFAHKVFALTSEEACDGADWVIFLGSDVETLAAIEMDYLDRVLAGDLVHLGRKDIRSSETDFLAVRVKGHFDGAAGFFTGQKFLNALRYVYTSGDIYNGAEFIDGYVTARLINAFEGMGAKVKNLSEGVPGLDVFEKTTLGEKMRHWKGQLGKKRLMEKLKA